MHEELTKLIESAKHKIDLTCKERFMCEGCPADVYGGECKAGFIAEHLINNGVVIVQYGEWLPGYPIHCSVCGGPAPTEYEDCNRYEAWLTKYCPNCGAIMLC